MDITAHEQGLNSVVSNQCQLYKQHTADGEYSCGDIGVSVEEWLPLLQSEGAKPYLHALQCFLREIDHKSYCSTLAKKYDQSPQHYISKITHFGRWSQRQLGKFKVLNEEGHETYWLVPMQRGWETKKGFEWQLRDELVEALQRLLMQQLIQDFATERPFDEYDETYKWQILDDADDMSPIEIAQRLRGENVVDNARVDTVLKWLWEKKPSALSTTMEHLFDESRPLATRLSAFKEEMRQLCPAEWKNCANDERTAAALLTCRFPEQYTFYKDEVYRLICRFLGIESRKTIGQKYPHFMEIIRHWASLFGNEAMQPMADALQHFTHKSKLLAVQTVFWCMRHRMRESVEQEESRYWLAGYSFGGTDSQLERFLKEGIWEGGFGDDVASDQQLLPLAQSIAEGDILILKSVGTKGKGHNLPFLRIKAVGIATSDVESEKTDHSTLCRCTVRYVSTAEKDFDGSAYGAFRKTLHPMDDKLEEIIDYVNSVIADEDMPTQAKLQFQPSKYQPYINLLKATHNLVLTGAPGTGKTYMAHEIAREMKAETRFVQFHPSYDYTDFVEGLRPIEKEDGQIGFERRDGIFKEFCREAIKNLEDSKKSVESLTKERSWQERLEQFVDDAIANETKYKLVSGSQFVIRGMSGRMITVHNEQNEKTTQVSVSVDDILELLVKEVALNNVKDIRTHFQRKFGTQPDSYAFVITKKVRSMKQVLPTEEAIRVERKPFVFIIDEINRGEASKIFGELFYAIDPGYRGKTDHLVQTQYQNLIPESDVFAKGFYVPENAYILATMNDIDRSVESMDFAMRRRFTWKEINPADTESMLNALPCADQAKATMHRLNSVLTETEGLGAAYQIGPSYFLGLAANGGNFQRLWELNIEPLLKEYLRGFRRADELMDSLRKAYFDTKDED